MALIITLIFIWFLIGAASFVYWYNFEFKTLFMKDELVLNAMVILLIFLCGFCGPISFFIGKNIHGKSKYKE